MFENINFQERKLWQEVRTEIKNRLIHNNKRSSVLGERTLTFSFLPRTLKFLVRNSGFAEKGERNAKNIVINHVEFGFTSLPSSFHGYRILHLSDLHIGTTLALDQIIQENLRADLVVITGDYQTWGEPKTDLIKPKIEHLIRGIQSRDGWISVLGNHDDLEMVSCLQNLGIRVLINESISINCGFETIFFVGTDDVVAFYTPESIKSLKSRQEGFRIALVHSADLATVAAEAGYSLYLCGHTHGGQVCFPGGKPVFTALDSHRHLAQGKWRVRNMVGYTNTGLGTGNFPYRFNCPGEAALIRLVKL